MTLATAALGGVNATDVRLSIPAWGASYADVTLDREKTLSGRVTLQLADLTLQGTVLTGGPATGRSFYRVVAGAGGWGKTLPSKEYQNDLGVKLITVLNDAAQECGETLDTTSFDTSTRLGPAFVRLDGPACRLLEQVSPSAWYVGEDGQTRLGTRPSTTLAAKAARVSQLDQARGTLTLASDTIAGILPGLVVDGLTVIDVEHTASAKDGLRSQLFGKQAGAASRRLSAFRKILDQLDPNRAFRGTYEYRIVTQSGNRLNLQPVRVSTGMPDLGIAFVRPGVPGVKADHTLGARVLVTFVDANPFRPVVVAFEDADGLGWKPGGLTIDATGTISIGASAPSVNVGAAPQALATAAEVNVALTAILAWADGLNTAAAVPGTDFTAFSTTLGGLTTTLDGAVAAAEAAIPTTVLKGT